MAQEPVTPFATDRVAGIRTEMKRRCIATATTRATSLPASVHTALVQMKIPPATVAHEPGGPDSLINIPFSLIANAP